MKRKLVQYQQIRRARLATLAEIQSEFVPQWMDPPPKSAATLRSWFKGAGVQCMKCNPSAKRGGGPVYYLIADVERAFRNRMRVATATRNGGAIHD